MKPSPRLIIIVRRSLLILAVIATLLAVFVVVENWRGDRAWADAERELNAKGRQLDLHALLPHPVPDELNIFKAPKLAHILYNPIDAEGEKILHDIHFEAFSELYDHNGRFDQLATDFTAMRARGKKVGLLAGDDNEAPALSVLNGMQPIQALLDELRLAARHRPLAAISRNQVPFELNVNMSLAFELSRAMAVRAAAEIELGRIEDAGEDIFALQRFANGFLEKPYNFLDVLTSAAIQNLTSSVISLGCQRHVWSELRLAEFQKQLGEHNLLSAFREGAEAERVQTLFIADQGDWLPLLLKNKVFGPRWLFHGIVQQNKVAYNRYFENDFLAAFTADRIFPDGLPGLDEKIGALRRTNSVYKLLPRLLLPSLGNLLAGLGDSVDRGKLGGVTWAIERYRLAHGTYPETLQELVPTFLSDVPTSVFDGQPFHYEMLLGGQRRIYSIGKNGRDDGGKNDDIVFELPNEK